MADLPPKPDRNYKGGLPSLDVRFSNALNTILKPAMKSSVSGKEKIPNASLIYGVSAALLFSVALYYLFTGLWFTGLLVLVLAVALFGYALVFLRYSG